MRADGYIQEFMVLQASTALVWYLLGVMTVVIGRVLYYGYMNWKYRR